MNESFMAGVYLRVQNSFLEKQIVEVSSCLSDQRIELNSLGARDTRVSICKFAALITLPISRVFRFAKVASEYPHNSTPSDGDLIILNWNQYDSHIKEHGLPEMLKGSEKSNRVQIKLYPMKSDEICCELKKVQMST